jgi:DNA-directed RNA polymerase subunit RPC12/RpoP
MNACKQDGLCDVYVQDEDINGLSILVRVGDTEWCCCTKEMCISSCPNSLLCRETEIPKIFLQRGRCTNCDVIFGKNLEMITSDQKYECPICMEDSENWVMWPGCPSEHKYCLDCSKTLHYGPQKPGVEEGEYERLFASRTERCPLCRFENIPAW